MGIIEDSFTEEQLELLVDMSTYYYESDSMVLGKYNLEGNSYILDAIESESTYFSTGDEIWNAIEEAGVSKSEVWRLNREVLDRAITEGKSIKFSHNPELYLTDDSYFGMEVDYLREKGYEFIEIEGEWYATI